MLYWHKNIGFFYGHSDQMVLLNWSFTTRVTFLFTRLESPGPRKVSNSPVSAENIIYEAFVVMGVVGRVAIYCI